MIFVLKPRSNDEEFEASIGSPYVHAQGYVIRASNERAARRIAAERNKGEVAEAWLDRSKTTCEEVDPDGGPGVLLVNQPTG